MEKTKSKYTIDDWSKKKVTILFLVFVCILFLSIIIGIFGPGSFIKRQLHFKLVPDKKSVRCSVAVLSLSRLNKELQISATFSNKKNYGVMTKVQIETQLMGNMSSSKSDLYNWTNLSNKTHTRTFECEPLKNCTSHQLVYQPYLNYNNYKLVANFDFEYLGEIFEEIYFNFLFVNVNIVNYEIYLRYSFVLIQLLFMAYYMWITKGHSFRHFNIKQKYTVVLLILLLFFNNPLFPVTAFDHTLFFRVFDAIFKITFQMVLFFYWLIIIESYRITKTKRKYLKYYLPRVSILVLIWIIRVIIYSVVWNRDMNDPQTEEKTDISGFSAAWITVFVFESIYFFWLFYASIRTISYLTRKIIPSPSEDEQKNLDKEKTSFFFFFFTSFIIFNIILIVYSFIIIPKFQSNSLKTTLVYVSLNAYIYFLAIAYTPQGILKKFSTKNKTIVKLEKKDEKEKLNEGSEIDDIDLNDSEKSQNMEMGTNSEIEPEPDLVQSQQSQSQSQSNSEFDNENSEINDGGVLSEHKNQVFVKVSLHSSNDEGGLLDNNDKDDNN
ncbi:transmembrane protein [Anaeramoeba flamelloides]|uniref:Transmembrane protein n=1 Tax=Anaeramoeba flamelloides TaxID=1746091 RepID=A0AAV7ZQX5_9EUKA|nr:transmembrane protein [Anaeramoeba flamelloides]